MQELYNLHNEKFGIMPVVIGLYYRNANTIIKNIIEAIEDNKPYNEYELLSDEEKKAFNSGELVF